MKAWSTCGQSGKPLIAEVIQHLSGFDSPMVGWCDLVEIRFFALVISLVCLTISASPSIGRASIFLGVAGIGLMDDHAILY